MRFVFYFPVSGVYGRKKRESGKKTGRKSAVNPLYIIRNITVGLYLIEGVVIILPTSEDMPPTGI